MEVLKSTAEEKSTKNIFPEFHKPTYSSRPNSFTEFWVRKWIRLHMLWMAIKIYGSIKKVKRVFVAFDEFRFKMFAGKRKFGVKNGKYWFGLYLPPFPSKNFDRYVQTEMNRYVPHSRPVNAYQQINYAITTKCPMRCEHCFEWDNLNLKETFSLEELKSIVSQLQQKGVGQISLSGGEPMARFKDMLELIRDAEKSTPFWVLTSGFNLDEDKAKKLKEAGATGVIVSLDHFDPDSHNIFRGHPQAFQLAERAAYASNKAGLVLAISLCVTRETANAAFLIQHASLAAKWGCDFIQWLEPKPEGHYRGKEVTLSQEQINEMESVYVSLNQDKTYNHIPHLMYHGYYQRRMGCLSGGKFSFYIDARGMVHSCPFCHSSDFKITEWLEANDTNKIPVTACKSYTSETSC
ncbi:radical SAM protein [Pararhodonellum marinum]|uniref:radical SAM protein n=1 Tax=Pararhodonellum marinum TaxID=2755358 RepID=UPI00188E8179|nr:radical SAM protein [Pararhodonellum marinum]